MDFDIVQLAELLNPTKDSDSESDEEKDIRADRKDSGKAEGKPNPYAKVEIDRKVQEDRDNADDSCKIVDDLGWELASDWQKTPEWNLSYKQQVTASDVFLGIGGRTPSTTSCEDMVVSISLPGEEGRTIDLKVLSDSLKLASQKFKLEIPLPHPVDPKLGSAKWDKETEKLVVTLRMQREFDYVNF